MSAQSVINWVKQNDPYLYQVALAKTKAEAQNLGETAPSGFMANLLDNIQKAGTALLQYKGQKKILDLQVERARQGLPPINAADYAPTIKTQIALDPETMQQAQATGIQMAKDGINSLKPIFFGALALGAFLMLKRR